MMILLEKGDWAYSANHCALFALRFQSHPRQPKPLPAKTSDDDTRRTLLFTKAKFHLAESRLSLSRKPQTKCAEHEQSTRHPPKARSRN